MYQDNGLQLRMNILKRDFQQHAVSLLEAHGWTWNIENEVQQGEYLLVKINRGDNYKLLALLYSQQTSKNVYDLLEKIVDVCLLNSMSYDPHCQFSSSFNKPIELLRNFSNILKDWNSEYPLNTSIDEEPIKRDPKPQEHIYLSAENPSEQCWMLINALRSVDVCKRYLSDSYKELSQTVINSKAEGIAFSIQNVCDYFDIAQSQNMTQKMLSLYYGALAFIEADILMNSNEYNDLKSVEEITKGGHGLFVFLPDESYDISSLYTGVLNKGLFYKWLKINGYDTENFPRERVKSVDRVNDYCYLFTDILNRIPELSFLMRMVDSNYTTGFFEPQYSYKLNGYDDMTVKHSVYKTKNTGTYIELIDKSCCSNLDMVKRLLGDIEQHSSLDSKNDDNYKRYSVFVKHGLDGKDKYWAKHVNIHISPYCSHSIIIPLKGLKDDWIVYAVMILYTFSIIVRYYPNLWRRIQYGEWDKYYTVCLQFAMIVEKVLPHIFYERITGQKLHISTARYS